jgi:hypothetical protein
MKEIADFSSLPPNEVILPSVEVVHSVKHPELFMANAEHPSTTGNVEGSLQLLAP